MKRRAHNETTGDLLRGGLQPAWYSAGRLPHAVLPTDDIQEMIRLSAVVITRNEAEMIRGCLESLAFCDEIIVVDSGSDDDTVAIARSLGATVVERDWPGFGPQKEFARSLARGEWVLSIDADERIPHELRQEIELAIANPDPKAYDMPRLSTFLGRPMRHSGWWPDRILRLFRRDSAVFSSDVVHERVVFNGAVGHLQNPIEHHPIRRLEDALRRMETYSSLGAAKLRSEDRRPGPVSGVLHGLFAFVSTYGLKRGFLDGAEGFANACIHAQTVFWKYTKAWMDRRSR